MTLQYIDGIPFEIDEFSGAGNPLAGYEQAWKDVQEQKARALKIQEESVIFRETGKTAQQVYLESINELNAQLNDPNSYRNKYPSDYVDALSQLVQLNSKLYGQESTQFKDAYKRWNDYVNNVFAPSEIAVRQEIASNPTPEAPIYREVQTIVNGNVQTKTVSPFSETESVVINGSRIDLPKEQAEQVISSGAGINPTDTSVTALKQDYRISKDTIEKNIILNDTWIFAGDKWNHIVNGKVTESSINAPISHINELYPSTPKNIFDSGVTKPITYVPSPQRTPKIPTSPNKNPDYNPDYKDFIEQLKRSDYYNIPNWLWVGLIIIVVIGISLGVKSVK